MASAPPRRGRSAHCLVRRPASDRPFWDTALDRHTARTLAALVLLAVAPACRTPEPPATLELTLSEDQGRREEFRVRSAFAEYVELPEVRNELRISLSNYERFCESPRSPKEDETLFTITVITPPGVAPEAGRYAWLGLDSVLSPDAGAPPPPAAATDTATDTADAGPEADAGPDGAPAEDVAPARRVAMPMVRRGAHGYLFEPGGALELKEVDLAQNGHVAGLVAFEFPGDGTKSRTSASGKFSARICRTTQVGGDH
jgi:hypothetical protein